MLQKLKNEESGHKPQHDGADEGHRALPLDDWVKLKVGLHKDEAQRVGEVGKDTCKRREHVGQDDVCEIDKRQRRRDRPQRGLEQDHAQIAEELVGRDQEQEEEQAKKHDGHDGRRHDALCDREEEKVAT